MKNLIVQECYPKMHGYYKKKKQEYLFIRIGMKDETFILYSVIKDILVDWDTRHSKYGHFTFDIRHISYILGWSNSKIYRVFNTIKDLGIAVVRDNKRLIYELVGYEMINSGAVPLSYISQLLVVFMQNTRMPLVITKMRLELEKIQQEISIMETERTDLAVERVRKNNKYNSNIISRSDVLGSIPLRDTDLCNNRMTIKPGLDHYVDKWIEENSH